MNRDFETLIVILTTILLFVILVIILIAISSEIFTHQIGKNIKQNEEITDTDKIIIQNAQNSIIHLWGVGTGFIYDEDNDNIYILTNKHVIEHYDLSKKFPNFQNRIYLPYVKFIDNNIKYRGEIQNFKVNSEAFSKQKYSDDISQSVENNNIDEKYFGHFNVDDEHDIAMIAISKKSFNISPNYKISKISFATLNPSHHEEIYVLGNAGGLQKFPILSKGFAIVGRNTLESFFTNRDKNFIKHDTKTYNGQSGSPTLNKNGELIGINTFSNGLEIKIPFIDKILSISSSTYSINNKIITEFIKKN